MIQSQLLLFFSTLETLAMPKIPILVKKLLIAYITFQLLRFYSIWGGKN